jgi:hypothetical protein
MGMQKEAANIGREGERSPEQEYISVNWQSEQQEEEGGLYRQAGVREGMNLDIAVKAPQVVTSAVNVVRPSDRTTITVNVVRPTTPRPRPGSARRASTRACVAHLSPLFNFTRGVPKGYLISWMGDSSNTHTVFLSFP